MYKWKFTTLNLPLGITAYLWKSMDKMCFCLTLLWKKAKITVTYILCIAYKVYAYLCWKIFLTVFVFLLMAKKLITIFLWFQTPSETGDEDDTLTNFVKSRKQEEELQVNTYLFFHFENQARK